jgi:ABC-2 type transport system ATP-binding protein
MIRIEGLWIRFGETAALQGLDLEVERGSVFGFLGPNGAGKTTTIRLMLGLLTPDAGSCRVMGFDSLTESHRIRAETGALLEHPGVYERLTVQENLRLFGRVNRLHGAALDVRVDEVLERFDLQHRRDDLSGRLSKGMKQKLGVARAIFHEPKLLVLDEPTSGLDPASAARLRADLTRLAAEGVTVFLTTHDLDEVDRICDRAAVIESGTLKAAGSLSELRKCSGSRKHRVRVRESLPALEDALAEWDPQASVDATPGRTGSAFVFFDEGHHSISELVAFLVDRGADVEEVVPVGSDLETAYLSSIAGGHDVA